MKRMLVLASILATAYQFVTAQPSFYVRHFNSQNDLPQNSVRSAEFDMNGYLWLTTEAGLVRYDGTSFKMFNESQYTELGCDRGLQLLKSYEGKLVVRNCEYDLFTYAPDHFIQLTSKLKGNLDVYLRQSIPNIRVYENILRTDLILNGAAIAPDVSISLYLLGESRFILIGNDKVMIYADTVIQKTISTTSYHPLHYLVSGTNLLFVDRLNQWHLINPVTGEITDCIVTGPGAESEVEQVLQDFHCGMLPEYCGYIRQGNRLFEVERTTDDHVYHLQLIMDGLPSDCIINCLAVDSARSIYAVGTDSKGLYVYRRHWLRSTIATDPETRISNVYYSQLALDSSRVLTSHQWIFNSNDTTTTKSGLGPFGPYALFRDAKGCLWYSNGSMIYCADKNYKVSHSFRQPVEGDVCSFTEAGGRLWVGSQGGLTYLENDSLKIIPAFKGSKLNTLVPLSDSSMLVGSFNGAFIFNWISHRCDTLQVLNGKNIRSFERIGNLIFIGSYGNGFFIMKEGKIVHAPADRFGYMGDVHSFLADDRGFVWMTTNRGLFKTTLTSLQRYWSDTTTLIYYYRYAAEDGILSDEFNGGCQPSHLRLANGYESLPTMEGLVWLKPDEVPMDLPTEKIFIERISVDQSARRISDTLHLPCNYRQVSIQFSTPYWGSPDNIWMDYRVAGDRQQWIPFGKGEKTLLLSRLPAGHYLIQIRKRSGFDSKSWVIKELRIKVAPYFYQTWWFLILGFLVFAGLLWLLIKWNSSEVLRRNHRLEAIIQLRTKELQSTNLKLLESERELQQSVKVKDKLISIISHDIVTPLRFISLSSKMARTDFASDSEALRNTLSDVRNAAGKLYDNARNILNWINHQNHRIRTAASNVSVYALVDEIFNQLDELLVQKDIRAINEVPEDDIILTDERLLSIVLYNVISNSAKFTRNGNIWVNAAPLENGYKITVTDNGNGMNSDLLRRINNAAEEQILEERKPDYETGGSGLGYIIISELIQLLGASYQVSSEPGAGTVVTIFLPLVMPKQQPVSAMKKESTKS